MKARTALEALYPAVQKRYNAARYGLKNGKPGIEVMFSNGPAFVSEDDFAELMAMFPEKPVDKLLFSLFVDDNDNNEDDEESFDISPEEISDEEKFCYNSGDYDDDFDNAHDHMQTKYFYRAMKDMKSKGLDVNDDATVEKLAEDMYNKDRKRVTEAVETRKNLLKGLQDKML